MVKTGLQVTLGTLQGGPLMSRRQQLTARSQLRLSLASPQPDSPTLLSAPVCAMPDMKEARLLGTPVQRHAPRAASPLKHSSRLPSDGVRLS